MCGVLFCWLLHIWWCGWLWCVWSLSLCPWQVLHRCHSTHIKLGLVFTCSHVYYFTTHMYLVKQATRLYKYGRYMYNNKFINVGRKYNVRLWQKIDKNSLCYHGYPYTTFMELIYYLSDCISQPQATTKAMWLFHVTYMIMWHTCT